MSIQHESRSGKDRRKFDLCSKSGAMKERRWNPDPRDHVMDADDIYDPDWDLAESDLEDYARISLDD